MKVLLALLGLLLPLHAPVVRPDLPEHPLHVTLLDGTRGTYEKIDKETNDGQECDKDNAEEHVPEAVIGDYAIIHVGFAISLLSEEEAQETLDLLRQIMEAGEMEAEDLA